jgi:hypothetical protein
MTTTKQQAGNPAYESVTARIQNRLDAIKEKDLLPPLRGVGPGVKVGLLTFEQRKMWTLMQQLGRELEPLMNEHRRLHETLQNEIGKITTISKILATAQKPEIQEAATRLDDLSIAIKPLMNMRKIVKNIFWNDVRTMFGSWDQQLWLDPDWTVRVQPEEDESSPSIGEVLGHMFSRRG